MRGTFQTNSETALVARDLPVATAPSHQYVGSNYQVNIHNRRVTVEKPTINFPPVQDESDRYQDDAYQARHGGVQARPDE